MRVRVPVRFLLALLLASFAVAEPGVSDPWGELGLRRGCATKQQVRAAYLRLARELHPDKNRENAARGADKLERFKRVLQAYEEITGAARAGPPPTADSPASPSPFVPPASTARRAGSAPLQQHTTRPHARQGGPMGLVDSCDMRVFTETVALEDMEEDVDEDAFAFDCRCSGRFILPWEGVVSARAEGRAEAAVNCQLCSLWILVTLSRDQAKGTGTDGLA